MKEKRSRLMAFAGFLGVQFILVISTERAAKAYVDPGSGALIWQGLLGALLGTAFYFRRIVGWVKTRFHGKDD